MRYKGGLKKTRQSNLKQIFKTHLKSELWVETHPHEGGIVSNRKSARYGE